LSQKKGSPTVFQTLLDKTLTSNFTHPLRYLSVRAGHPEEGEPHGLSDAPRLLDMDGYRWTVTDAVCAPYPHQYWAWDK
jgi:hypothetical protein